MIICSKHFDLDNVAQLPYQPITTLNRLNDDALKELAGQKLLDGAQTLKGLSISRKKGVLSRPMIEQHRAGSSTSIEITKEEAGEGL
ncbi:hypothetical protein HI914_06858 [Erysiphe necator]|nr:hypothetical protein HI914_06858 [Erysiphe necator]